ncbi:hypothetical protein [Pectinatus frisingensis]|uniref:hypothetical protein n=1 Tax=Pectinatus frisingensis TaxID=865 RepID=UPI0018C52201|nr:hypothetical protein [Pectinatus frisingensis]
MLRKTLMILSMLLLLSNVICYAGKSTKKPFVNKTLQITYPFMISRNDNAYRELLNEYNSSCGSKSKNHNDSWNISYDSDDKYIDYYIALSNEFDDISFTQSIDYTGVHSYGLNLGIAYNF